MPLFSYLCFWCWNLQINNCSCLSKVKAGNNCWLQTNPSSALPFPWSERSVYSTVVTVHTITHFPNNSGKTNYCFRAVCCQREGFLLSGVAEVCRVCLHCIMAMSGPSLFYGAGYGGSGSPEVWLGLHGFFRLVLLSVLNLTQSWLTCHASLARCFEASFSCSDTSQLSFQCRASACPRCGCAIQRAVTIPVASSLLRPQRCALCCHRALNSSLPGLSLVNTLVSAWFGNAVAVRWSSSCGWESALQVLPCCTQAMLWVLQRIMFRDWRPEILQLLGPCKSYKGQVHQIPSSWWHVTVGVTPWRCCGRQTLRCTACSQGTCCSRKLDLKLALPLGFCNGTGC